MMFHAFLAFQLAMPLSLAPSTPEPPTSTLAEDEPTEPTEPTEPLEGPVESPPEPEPETETDETADPSLASEPETPPETPETPLASDAPPLERQPVYEFEPDQSTRARSARRATAGGVLLGVGATLGLAAPIFMLRPVKPFFLDTGTNGTSTKIGTEGGPIAAGLIVGFAGGVFTAVGARLCSDLLVEPSRVTSRRRVLHISSGLAFGVATGLLVGAAIDGVRAGVQWNTVLGRAASPDDAIDGQEVASKASRSLALFSVVPALLGIGIGLRGGEGARVAAVPTGSGMAIAGRF